MDLQGYARAFDEAERDFEEAVEAFGVAFEPAESQPRARRRAVAEACGYRCENGDASLWRGWISPACLACRTGERTATFFIDLRCTRSCYFCFNPNQDGYEHFLSHKRDVARELEQARAAGERFSCVALTGGEPMLYRSEAAAFFRRANELFPGVHTRLYTSGDLLDEEGLRELAASGLAEVRFSVKPCGGGCAQEGIFDLMEAAVRHIPDVMIEVPVIPGSFDEMKEMLLRADAIGVRGVNLLEFCFPLARAEEFRARGFRLRKRPYAYLYNYWYGGGIPVAGSEADALALAAFAAREGLRIGVHYCSSDNKNTGQIFQQNKAFDSDGALRRRYPWMAHDEQDRFLKCAKAFGGDVGPVRSRLDALGEAAYGVDEDIPSIAFPLSRVEEVRAGVPHAQLAASVNVVEDAHGEAPGDGTPAMREVAVERLRA